MKAILRTRYGPPDVIQFADRAIPAPREHEVLVQLRAASVNPLDLFLLKGAPWNRITGLRSPRQEILGCDVAGLVEAIGSGVTRFRPGDRVFGGTGFKGGGFAEYLRASEQELSLMPQLLSFENAASLPVAGCTALQGLRDKGFLKAGQGVLIEGASGGVGTFAVQIAKVLGAEVTAVCSRRNLEQARRLGADVVIDYAEADFTRCSQRYDLVFSANARHSLFDYRRLLKPGGTYVAAGCGPARVLEFLLLGPLLSRIGKRKMRFFLANINPEDLAFLARLVDGGKVTPVIERCYPLSDAAEALRYLAEGHAQGKIILVA